MSNSNVTGKLSTTLGDGSHNRRVELVWKKGIAQSCDRRFPEEFPEYRDYCPVPLLASALQLEKLQTTCLATPSHWLRSGRRVNLGSTLVVEVLCETGSTFG